MDSRDRWNGLARLAPLILFRTSALLGELNTFTVAIILISYELLSPGPCLTLVFDPSEHGQRHRI